MSPRTLMFVICFACCVPAPLSAADTVDDIEKHVVEKWADIKSMSANMTMIIHSGAPEPLKSTGTIKLLNDGGVEKKRMTMTFDAAVPGQAGPIEQTVIYDGEFAWTVRKAPDGRQIAAKQRPDAMEGTPGGKDTFAQLREVFSLKVLPETSVAGESTYVLEATPKQPTGRGIAKYHFFFAKDSGILTKTVGFKDSDEPVNEILFTDITVNPKLDASQFVAKFDPDTQVLDMTKPPGE